MAFPATREEGVCDGSPAAGAQSAVLVQLPHICLCTHQKHLHDHAKVEWKCLSAHMVDLIQSCLVVDAFARPPEWASEDLGDSCSGDAN